MAFRTPPQEVRAESARLLPRGVAHLASQHEQAVQALLAVADAGQVDTDAVLGAIKRYRESRSVLRAVELDLAEVLIAGGVAPGTVCARLGIGRSALQQRLRTRPWGDALVGPGKRPTRRAA